MHSKIISTNHLLIQKGYTLDHGVAREYILDDHSYNSYLEIINTPIGEEVSAIGFYNALSGQLFLDTHSEGHIYSALDFDILTKQNDLKDNWFGIVLGIYNNKFTLYDQSGQFGKLPREDLAELKIILDKCFGPFFNSQ